MKVLYQGHSAWIVYTANLILLFDNTEDRYLDFDKFSDKRVVLFFSHEHKDHYNKNLHERAKKFNNVTTILGGFGVSETDNNSYNQTIVMHPHETRKIILDGKQILNVYSGESTDAGVCFYIETNGLAIFHAGDHSDWGDGDPANKRYYHEIDIIRTHSLNASDKGVDIIFIPICTFNGSRPKEMTKAAIYAINVLNPKVVFPMHANGHEELYEMFATDAYNAGIDTQIICMKEIGQIFELFKN